MKKPPRKEPVGMDLLKWDAEIPKKDCLDPGWIEGNTTNSKSDEVF